jgi:hypothetical protein
VRNLDAGDVEGGGKQLADCYAKNDDRGLHEFVDDLAFVGHGRRVNGNVLMVQLGVQIILKICSNVSGEKIKTKCRAGMRMWVCWASATRNGSRDADQVYTGRKSRGQMEVPAKMVLLSNSCSKPKVRAHAHASITESRVRGQSLLAL